MRFVADLHVHSRYSRATSREADLAGYHRWARVKGIGVVGTGDFTHPGWIAELDEQLVEKDGLYALKEPPRGSPLEGATPGGYDGPLHPDHGNQLHLQEARTGAQGAQPDRRAHAGGRAQGWARKLAAIGNIASDGQAHPRPGPQGPPLHAPGNQRQRRSSSPPTSGRHGSPSSAPSPASTASRTASRSLPRTSSPWRRASPPIRR